MSTKVQHTPNHLPDTLTGAALTPWFPSAVSPVRKGLYEVRFNPSGDVFTRWWGGSYWLYEKGGGGSVFGYEPTGQEQWRGLVSNPSKRK
jgi:hypothetical protein